VYLELGGDLDEEVIARAGARALMDGADCISFCPEAPDRRYAPAPSASARTP
jgi:hypothetical protein